MSVSRPLHDDKHMASVLSIEREAHRSPRLTETPSGALFDDALLHMDIAKAERLHNNGQLRGHRSQLCLYQYIRDKKGDEGYSDTLVLLLREGIYDIKAMFVEYVLQEFPIHHVIKTIKAIEASSRCLEETGRVLHLAVGRMNVDVYNATIRLLLKSFTRNQVFIDIKDSSGRTALFYFIKALTTDFRWFIFDDLLSRKANINVVDDYGDTPLTLAVKLHKLKVALALIKSPSFRNCDHLSQVFHIYLNECELDMNTFKIFLGALRLNNAAEELTDEGRTWIHSLLHNKLFVDREVNMIWRTKPMSDIVNYLLKIRERNHSSHLMLDVQDKAGDLPLMAAIKRHCPITVLELLLPSREKADARDYMGFTSLALLLYKYDGKSSNVASICMMIDRLVQLGASSNLLNPCCKMDENESFLCILPENKCLIVQIVEYLIQRLNIIPSPHEVEATITKFRFDLTLVYLKACSANEESRTLVSNHPTLIFLICAIIKSCKHMIKPEKDEHILSITKHVVNVNVTHLKSVFAILAEKFDLDLNIKIDGRTLLHFLIELHDTIPMVSIVKQLIMPSASARSRVDPIYINVDTEVGTALAYALRLGHFPIAELLVENYATLERQDLLAIAPKVGFSAIFIKLENGGIRVPDSFFEYMRLHHQDSSFLNEVQAFEEWLRERANTLLPLKVLANKAFRKFYRRR
ncbi:hypothetical protein HDE_11760 [Halotydeus destructor]|nr:hypothetical protein HDE_11760 [Halotydeus destructor]